MSKITITNGKLLKGDIVEIEYQQRDSVDSDPANCSYKQGGLPRKELKKAFDKLAAHAAIIGEFISADSLNDLEDVDLNLVTNFTVTSFSISSKKTNEEGVKLNAYKTLSNGEVMQLNLPIKWYNTESDNAYKFLGSLESDIKICQDELVAYLNGVRGDDPQQKLDLQ